MREGAAEASEKKKTRGEASRTGASGSVVCVAIGVVVTSVVRQRYVSVVNRSRSVRASPDVREAA